ncbi:protein FAM136A-like [Acanthaster planci]|uniref:Protein FAM136A-like n=1 Tax=Acanthaster planci TaxID=133434 RepID=A0A8B7Y3Z3_ACAPL|nr:protein FAM136A-like [Acanthaster planci]XP_022086591.1 protein FAM136A-like [Acanthaster planci]XP_022086592.1 protein FAM136A-like [Acanthaster planci]XP_022086593.1 protein FAM136A-like [Acanthaster planci]
MAESIAVQACKKRVDDAVSAMVNQLDQETFRSMQREMYLKSAKCCENSTASMSEVQSCIEKCSQPLQAAQNYMQSELNDFLDRLQRCGMQCQDNIKDRLVPSATPAQVDKLKAELEDCVIKCGEKHINLLGPMKQRIQSNMAQFR